MPNTALFLLGLIVAASGPIDRARSQYEDFEFDRAQLTLQKALASPDLIPSQKAEAHLWLGLCKLQVDDSEGARQSFAEGLQLDLDVVLPDLASPKAQDIFIAEKKQISQRATTSTDLESTEQEPGLGSTSDVTQDAEVAWQPYSALGLAAGGVVSLVGGAVMAALAVDQNSRATDSSAFADEAAQAAADSALYSSAAIGFFVGAGVLAIGAGAIGALWVTSEP